MYTPGHAQSNTLFHVLQEPSDQLRVCLAVLHLRVPSTSSTCSVRLLAPLTVPSPQQLLQTRVLTRTTSECSVRRPRRPQLSVPLETLDWPALSVLGRDELRYVSTTSGGPSVTTLGTNAQSTLCAILSTMNLVSRRHYLL